MALSPQLGTLRVLHLHAGLGGATQRVYEAEPEGPSGDTEGSNGSEGLEGPGIGVGMGVRRRVILTDTLGEASFSLSAVRYVIDTGMQLKTVSIHLSEVGGRRSVCGTILRSGLIPVVKCGNATMPHNLNKLLRCTELQCHA